MKEKLGTTRETAEALEASSRECESLSRGGASQLPRRGMAMYLPFETTVIVDPERGGAGTASDDDSSKPSLPLPTCLPPAVCWWTPPLALELACFSNPESS